MTGRAPLVTIAMTVYNGERTLALAIRSILAQTFRDWRLVLIDDGSTDATLEVARRFSDPRIQVISDGQRRGISRRLNQIVASSESEYLARMDADDISYPWRLERQANYLKAYDEVALAGTWLVVFRGAGDVFGRRCHPEMHSEICAKPIGGFPIAHPTFMGRLEFFRTYPYCLSCVLSEDQDILLRAYRFSRFANVPEILLGYREEDLYLRKLLRSRIVLTRSIFREFRREKRPAMALRGVAEQVLKGLVDSLACLSGLKYRVVRHRALPLAPGDRGQWEQVWSLVNVPAACEQD